MSTDRDLLFKAAEFLSRNSRTMPGLVLGEEIYKHLYGTEQTPKTFEQKVEEED